MSHLSIGEVAQRIGVRTSALRYYESIGLIPAPSRVNGRRVYDKAIFSRLAWVQYTQAAGFTLAEIKSMLDGMAVTELPRLQWQQLAHQKLDELDAKILQFQLMKEQVERGLACACTTAADCVVMAEIQGDLVNEICPG